MRSRPGFTLLDQLLAIGILAVLFAVGAQHVGSLRDRLAVRAAGLAVRDVLALAREHANASGVRTAVRLARADAQIAVHVAGDTITRVRLGHLYGVGVDATRDSLAYRPSGLGYGAANLSIVLERGSARDTVAVSRLGRVR